MSFINNLWYGRTLSSFLCSIPLLPLSGVFAVIAAARRSMYSNGLCRKSGPVVPVVVVGGITAGGTGKTPLCIAIVNDLISRGLRPGVLSRGYKAKCKNHPCQVPLKGSPVEFGDEPCLIRRETMVPVVIDPDRVRGADYLASLGVDVIITDDGLQHYSLDRDVEICVLDGARMLGNEHLLPAGPLREAKWRLKTVDSVVVTGAVAHLGYFPMMMRPVGIEPINPESQEVLDNKASVCAIGGIGNPDRFYKSLEDYGFTVARVEKVGDHCAVSMERLKKLADSMPVIMTAKDAIKYAEHADQLSNVFVFNVQANLSKQFFDDVASKIKQATYKVRQRVKKREAEGYTFETVEAIEKEEADRLLEQRRLHLEALQRRKVEQTPSMRTDICTVAFRHTDEKSAEEAERLLAEQMFEETHKAPDAGSAASKRSDPLYVPPQEEKLASDPACKAAEGEASAMTKDPHDRPIFLRPAVPESRRFDPLALPKELKLKNKK